MWVGDKRHVPAALTTGKTRYRRLDGHQNRSETVRKISPPTGILSPDRPARSELLYWLSCPGSSSVRISSYLITQRHYAPPTVTSVYTPHKRVHISQACTHLTSVYTPHKRVHTSQACTHLTSVYKPHKRVHISQACTHLTSVYILHKRVHTSQATYSWFSFHSSKKPVGSDLGEYYQILQMLLMMGANIARNM